MTKPITFHDDLFCDAVAARMGRTSWGRIQREAKVSPGTLGRVLSDRRITDIEAILNLAHHLDINVNYFIDSPDRRTVDAIVI